MLVYRSGSAVLKSRNHPVNNPHLVKKEAFWCKVIQRMSVCKGLFSSQNPEDSPHFFGDPTKKPSISFHVHPHHKPELHTLPSVFSCRSPTTTPTHQPTSVCAFVQMVVSQTGHYQFGTFTFRRGDRRSLGVGETNFQTARVKLLGFGDLLGGGGMLKSEWDQRTLKNSKVWITNKNKTYFDTKFAM